MNLNAIILRDMQAHARDCYPQESCGLIVAGEYRPCVNRSDEPEKTFAISSADILAAGDKLEAVVHSHPDGPVYPSEEDMRQQIAMNVPWMIIPLFEDKVGPPIMWGDGLPIAPLIGRTFIHGVADCYSLIRDIYRMGKEACALEGVDWPFDSIELLEFPRRDGWWDGKTGEPQDLYRAHFAEAGFVEISREEARAGDVWLKAVNSPVLTHGGVLLSGGLILHHLPKRLSRREPAGLWGAAVDVWLRHKHAS